MITGGREADRVTRYVGRPRAPLEAGRHVRGRARFVADLQLPGLLEAAFVRSPYPHARIVSVDVSDALAMEGVRAVVTGAEVAVETTPVFTMAALHDPPLPMPLTALAHEKVRHAGEPVVAIAAVSRAVAEDAAERVRVDYEPLTPLLSPGEALAPGAPRIYDGVEANTIMRRSYDFGEVDGAFERAARVVRRRLVWSRHTASPLETFACVADWDEGRGEVVFWSNLQSNALLWTLGPTLGLPAHRIRGVPCDIGGAFGSKFWQPRPLVATALLSKRTGRPVRFVEDRVEHLEGGDNHGEDRVYDAELALDEDGRMRALRYRVVEDYGSAFVLGAIGMSEPLAQAVGPYRIEAVGVDFTAALTTKTAQAAYRGFGGAALNFVIERMADAAADGLGISRVELRARNLIQPDAFPYRIPTGNVYDSGDYPEALRRALAAADYDGWRRRQEVAWSEGRAVGIGIATCQERSVQGAGALWLMFDQRPGRSTTAAETATVRIDGQGNVRVGLHSPSLGTPAETVAATVAGEELGVDPSLVVVTRLDTAIAGPALGPNASRLTVMLAGAVAGAAEELREQMRGVAAGLLGAEGDALEWRPDLPGFAVPGDDARTTTLGEIAHHANSHSLALPPGIRSGLESTYTYDHPFAELPSEDGSSWGVFAPIVGHAVHIPIVEVDVETGEVRFLAYTVVADCGTILNPEAVRGQVIGAVAQGIGCALGEQLTYDAAGRLVERDLRSYLMPTSLDTPPIDVHHLETPSPYTWRGVKGVGEGGRMAAPPAVVSAVEDALRPWGVRIDEIPVTPEKVLQWIEQAEAVAGHPATRPATGRGRR